MPSTAPPSTAQPTTAQPCAPAPGRPLENVPTPDVPGLLAAGRQGSFDDLGCPLSGVVFVVVDLETTGGSPSSCDITEIGAVKVQGGQVLGEFQTLVRPGMAIPAFIAVLTGITDGMVAAAPRLSAALPAFLEFARGAVLVAHNAPFDLGFLREGCERLGIEWPRPESVDTARLARRVLTRDETPNCKLSTLATLFKASEPPCHRALADARATVDVLHGLFERLGPLGVTTLEELRTFSSLVPPGVRRKRYLADALPAGPGVYVFRDAGGRALYVGTSRNLRTRVRSYFTASEPRARMAEMVRLAERVDAVPCATPLEAEVRELRLIAEHKPRYNRRSRHPERAAFIKLTLETFPRLSIVRSVRDDGALYLGPLSGRPVAERVVAALHEAFPLRQCTIRLAARRPIPACVLAEMGRCGAPCDGRETPEQYAAHVAGAARAMTGDARSVVTALSRRMGVLAGLGRFEEAAVHSGRLLAFVRAAARLQRLIALTALAEVVAAAPTPSAGWELAVVRHGRLVAAGVVPRGAAVRPYVEALQASAERVAPGAGPVPCATAEETERVLRWLERPGVRLVVSSGAWCSPAYGAQGQQRLLRRTEPDALPREPRHGRPLSRPARAIE